jgi:hypothetical protein
MAEQADLDIRYGRGKHLSKFGLSLLSLGRGLYQVLGLKLAFGLLPLLLGIGFGLYETVCLLDRSVKLSLVAEGKHGLPRIAGQRRVGQSCRSAT